jgi:CheY-like chemotaxis protein
MGKGNFDALVPVNSKDELGQLADALNQMTLNLKNSIDANQTKSTFLANMSHEIRTPLGAILGFSELILNHDLSEREKEEASEVIRRNGNLLSHIIDDILDLSKVEAGKLEIDKVEANFEELLSEIQTLLSLKAREKGITLTITTESTVPKTIVTDTLRVRQILFNIVGNAIKFTEKGFVEVRVKMIPVGKEMKLAFIVKDSGKGISPEEARRLFAPFTQADTSTTRKFGGTGLGLILSKKLALALGGDVVLSESSTNTGSTFIITIDPGSAEKVLFHNYEATKPPTKIRSVTPPVSLQNLQILVVDDSLDNQLIISHLLRRAGAMVETADNGRDGVDKAITGNFSLVLMDLQMPVMDGFNAISELRSRGYSKPVIALTAHTMKEEKRRCLERGFDDHLSKPIDIQNLFKTISRFHGLRNVPLSAI